MNFRNLRPSSIRTMGEEMDVLMSLPALPPSPRVGYTTRDDFAKMRSFPRDETRKRVEAAQKLQSFYRKQKFTHRRAQPMLSTSTVSFDDDGARGGDEGVSGSGFKSSLQRSIERDEL